MASMKWMDVLPWANSTEWTGRQQSEPMRNAQAAQDSKEFAEATRQYQLIQQQMNQRTSQQGTQLYGPNGPIGSDEVKDRYEITDHTPEAVEVAVIEKPVEKPVEKPIPSALTEIKTDLKEYAELAAIVGIAPAELTIEAFKAFLHEHDIPVFNLKEVITYMDDKAKRESKNPFGTEAKRRGSDRVAPASDYYAGHFLWDGKIYSSSQKVYDKLVPLHALKKVALIEKHFGDKVGMFVCDYAPIPAYPDPFLMAVIANPKVREGEGRFVIDLWDEPGFGLQSQLK